MKANNKLLKSDSQRVAFLLCVGLCVWCYAVASYGVAHTLIWR
ncbi:hypothetical protein VCRA2119O54_70118 [Vibrio crassostreae]|nr:hypothetical protein EDB73_101256 [Vibrio crassostreae]TCL30539.1 hypothetical protein EDB52_101826 [Vibrio crassostreae]TCT53374.1 hypothetical protein EDB39_101440 [Vibrio crassostreae]TCT57660.1 hypothetical protein EDB40_108131 [Vibrio crassostreae]TCV57683.1 hypothetical protein EDB74_11976 [Vibrio crassostreae]